VKGGRFSSFKEEEPSRDALLPPRVNVEFAKREPPKLDELLLLSPPPVLP